MPNTPIYALPYPASSDPADVPVDLQELADRMELMLTQRKVLLQAADNEETVPSLTAWNDLPSGPTLTLPVAGDYLCRAIANVKNTSTGAQNFLGIGPAGSQPGHYGGQGVAVSGVFVTVAVEILITAPTPNYVIKCRYYCAGAAGTFSNRSLSAVLLF